MIEAADPVPICFKHKAITSFFPYAAQQGLNGQHEALDVFLHAARASRKQGFMWHRIKPPIPTLLNERGPVFLKEAIILASPHSPWWNSTNNKHLIQPLADAASAVPYTDEIGQSMVDTLLQIASNHSLLPNIPISMWSWLNKCPLLPPLCTGRYLGTTQDIVQVVQALGNIGILKSYLFLVWSEWDCLYSDGLDQMCTSIRDVFGGTGMGHHREDLLQWVDNVLGQLDLGLGHLQQHNLSLGEDDIQRMKKQYGKLKEVLLELDREMIGVLIRESPRLGAIF